MENFEGRVSNWQLAAGRQALKANCYLQKGERLSRGASPERLVKLLARAKYRFADG
jgi:hypothetical protein